MTGRIAAVRTRILEAALEQPVQMSFGHLEHRRMVLVEVESSDGVVGYGESWVNYPTWTSIERVATIQRGIAPLLLDTELTGVRSVVHRLRAQLGGPATQLGGQGPLHQAISGVEIAMFDLIGKTRGISVAELLGGVVRGEIPVYASAVSPVDASEVVERCIANGFRALKCRVGFGRATDNKTLSEVRALADDSVKIYADANQAWSVPEAVESIRELSEYGIEWFEEPVRRNRLDDLEILFKLTGAGLATGENNYGLDEFARLACSPAIRVLQPDVSKVGGIRETDLIAELASATKTSLIPHAYGGPLALAATAQLAAAADEIEAIEYDVRDHPLAEIVESEWLKVELGSLTVPETPGLGIELNSDAIQRYEVTDD